MDFTLDMISYYYAQDYYGNFLYFKVPGVQYSQAAYSTPIPSPYRGYYFSSTASANSSSIVISYAFTVQM